METVLEVLDQPKHQLRIGLVGKYVELQDAYKSILEALLHAGVANEGSCGGGSHPF